MLPMVRNMFMKLSTTIVSQRSIFAPLIMGFLTRWSHELFHMLHGNGDCRKLKYIPVKGVYSNCFNLMEILHHIKLDNKKHCSTHLLSYVLTHDGTTLTNTAHACALDCLFLCTVHTKQAGYECFHINTC